MVLIAPLFFFMGSAVSTPSPEAELKRLSCTHNDDLDCRPVQQFITDEIKPEERVAIIHPYGYQLANDCGIRNYFPFTGPLSILAREQLDFVLKGFKTNNVRHVFMESVKWMQPRNTDEARRKLREHGYRLKNKLDYNRYPIELRNYDPYKTPYQVEHWIK